MTVRTRFAPSPTGYLHVGGIRTALFAFLVARQADGQFVLRLEDTDKVREVEGSAEHLIASLKSLGLYYDEGPDIGGLYGPYKQSDRLATYKEWAQKLIEQGRAYADPYTQEEIQGFREQAQAEKRAFRYRDHRPENPPAWDGQTPLRFKSEPKSYTYHDEVMGDITTSPEVVDDFILIKSDGYPTYNFAHIVDDAEMNITHVIRGQEFISSMPNYLALYEALGLEPPIFAHMPHIMNEQGNKKLGKRDGAKDVLDYIRDGYLPETLDSFIATMGWNDGTEQEVFTMAELIEKFSLDRVQRSGARFDEKRLLWMNGHFIRELSLDELYKRVEFFWPESAKKAPESYKKQVLTLAQDRLKTLRDLPNLTSYFFEEPHSDLELITINKQLKKLDSSEQKVLLSAAIDELSKVETWNPIEIQESLNQLLETTGQKPGILFSLVRIATTWAPFSPQLNDTLALLGKEKSLARLSQAIESI
ncbi:MAG TPA: glutamate--tRNA ligase [Candidatus Saccharimonadales bacterium]